MSYTLFSYSLLLLKLWRMPELLFKREEEATLAYFTSVDSVYIVIMGMASMHIVTLR